MSSKLQVYEDERFGRVRTVMGNDGEPWFVLRDICAALGIEKPENVAGRIPDDEKGTRQVGTLCEVLDRLFVADKF